ncbi:MAG TPA: hypothetical protein VMZ52_02160, partial [Bryobacteraceae bacterium]|nr:hypothetical protein [Bryobacteraceae bacterium]
MLRSIVWLAAVSFCAAAGTQRLPQKTSVGSKLKEQPVPVVFEPNRGQIDGSVRFVGRGRNHTLFLREKEVVMSVASGAVHMRLVGANPNARAEGMEPLPGVSNYLLGKDPARWRTGIPHFAKVRYRDVYPGIDLVFYTNQRDLEYDFVVA